MDEIDWLKNIKKGLILLTTVCVQIAIVIGIPMLTLIGNGNIKIVLFIPLCIGIGFPSIFGICYLIFITFFKILTSGRKVINFNKEYIRDLPKHCNPAICSLIYDLKIDVYKDYTAIILYLCIKRYINLAKDGNTYKVELVKEQDYSNLGRCEKYILNIIENKVKFDENQFKREIIKDAQEKGFITNRKHSKIPKIALTLILIVSSLFITYYINKIVFIVSAFILATIVPFLGYMIMEAENENALDIGDTEYIRTEDGKNIALLLSGLKRYIKEYTLIKEKEIDYIQILENYIPYALALDEADAVEEFIKHNEEYRDLIYNRKSVQ